jgi:RNase H-fold protein (predicted Holliday junction resolvase)
MLEVFIERGDQLSESRRLMTSSPEYSSALALVSIHCAIALNDAFLVKLTGKHQVHKDHIVAAKRTRKQCSSKRIPSNGVKHLEELLKAKTRVSYSDERTTSETANRLAVASERFEAWVRPLMRQ